MSKKEHTAILRVGTQLVSQLVETLLHETEGAQPDPARLGSVLHALSIFCAARPTMLLPHIELLPTYLQYQHQEAAPAVRHVCEMLPRLLPLLDHPPRKLLEKCEKYLTALIFRVPEESMGGVIRALCAVCQVSKNTQLVGDTLARLCHLLRKQDAATAGDSESRDTHAATNNNLLSIHSNAKNDYGIREPSQGSCTVEGGTASI